MQTKTKSKGRFHMAVYFVQHRQPEGKPYYFWSNKGQDKAGSSANRLKRLVHSKNWRGRVNWAGLYEDNQEIATYSLRTDQWQSR